MTDRSMDSRERREAPPPQSAWHGTRSRPDEGEADGGVQRAPTAEIIRLPGLHERPDRAGIAPWRRDRPSADILAFPLPRWQRNALRHGG